MEALFKERYKLKYLEKCAEEGIKMILDFQNYSKTLQLKTAKSRLKYTTQGS